MISAVRIRLYQTKEQEETLDQWLEESRQIYNSLLEASINAYKNENKRLLGYDLQKSALRLRKEKGFTDVYAQSTQDIADRVTKAFKNFFRRVKEGKHGKKAGFPRFKSFGRYKSITFPQYPHGFKILDDDLLSISGLGIFKMRYLKDIDGRIKTLTLKKESTGNWYAIIICEGVIAKRKAPAEDKPVGVDVGIHSIIATSDGITIPNPRILVKSEKVLKRRHRQLSKKRKGSKNKNKARVRLARAYSKIKKRRETFLHGITNDLIANHKVIFLEKLQIQNMVRNHRLSKAILDAVWGELARQLSYKAEEAGSTFLQIDPRNTSKTCSQCGWLDEDQTLNDRVFICESCGLELDRDINASKNILRIGLGTLGRREINACGDETSTLEKSKASIVAEAGKGRIW